ncbi:MAG TPA: glycosyltransferase family 4 protein [Streptosporangiaceae bacterium]
MKRKRICLLHVPVFNPARAIGGAEVIAVDVVRWLSEENDVTVLHGFLGEPAEPTATDYPAEIVPGFRLGDHGFKQLGHIRPDFTAAAMETVTSADVIMSVENSLDMPTPTARVVLMGGVGYPHTHDIMRHRSWDRLVVPSSMVARQVSEAVGSNPQVTVIENGIDTNLFSPNGDRPDSRPLRLLIPSRPTLDKGFARAAELTSALTAAGYAATLVIFDQPDGFSQEGLRGLAAESACDVEILPWQPRSAMPGIYCDADLTLCLGTAVEGFGLVAAESVACGTPVLSHSGGFLKEMLPADHGLYHADPALPAWQLAQEALSAVRAGRRQCQQYGRPYIENRYSLRRMGEQFTDLMRAL